jgi:GH15 family glucan-1,4-alpha-glucosidase
MSVEESTGRPRVSLPIEDYAMIGDCHTAALVSKFGSIDWLCFPHFDSAACFAALLGTAENGHWTIAPAASPRSIHRRYRSDTLILETDFETEDGCATVVDCMTPRDDTPDLLRMVVGKRGRVHMQTEVVVRFDYGSVIPWVRRTDHGITAIAGPDMLSLRTDVPLRGENFKTIGEFTVSEGEKISFDLTWYPSHKHEPQEVDVEKAIEDTTSWWEEWSGRCTYDGPWREAVLRSLITLKALTFLPTGGIAAAATTSLPECLGGVRNWDYRFCWVRDATLTLHALVNAGYLDEAKEWREWLLRAVAGNPSQMNILYGLRGERRLTELKLPWLAGYEDSAPVRIGNAAYKQFQLDIFGEVIDTLFQCRIAGLQPHSDTPAGVATALIKFLEDAWKRPDEGIWEVRGPRRHFTHSKMMAWVALDRAVKSVERGWFEGDLEHWKTLREKIHRQVCEKGFDPDLNSFVQFYGSKHLDAALLMMPLVGFLPADDPRVLGTVTAIEKYLLSEDGFVARYSADPDVDGMPHGEARFIACTFWLADNYILQGRHEDAVRTFEHVLKIRNDVGLLSEEYDHIAKRLVGNYPQAFSHIGLVNTAIRLSRELTQQGVTSDSGVSRRVRNGRSRRTA